MRRLCTPTFGGLCPPNPPTHSRSRRPSMKRVPISVRAADISPDSIGSSPVHNADRKRCFFFFFCGLAHHVSCHVRALEVMPIPRICTTMVPRP